MLRLLQDAQDASRSVDGFSAESYSIVAFYLAVPTSLWTYLFGDFAIFSLSFLSCRILCRLEPIKQMFVSKIMRKTLTYLISPESIVYRYIS